MDFSPISLMIMWRYQFQRWTVFWQTTTWQQGESKDQLLLSNDNVNLNAMKWHKWAMEGTILLLPFIYVQDIISSSEMDSHNPPELCHIKTCAIFVAHTRSIRKTPKCHPWEKLWDDKPGKTSDRKWIPMHLEWNAMGCKVRKSISVLCKG